jgi:hypothetical protein
MVLTDRDFGIPWMSSPATLHRSQELAHVVCADYVTYGGDCDEHVCRP